MNPQITHMGADFKPVEFDGFRFGNLITSNSRVLKCFNRVEFDTVGNYGDFATIKEGSTHG